MRKKSLKKIKKMKMDEDIEIEANRESNGSIKED